jgi:hypothetical protein
MKSGRTGEAQRNLALFASVCSPRGFKHAIKVGKRRTGALKKDATGFGQLNSARHPAK